MPKKKTASSKKLKSFEDTLWDTANKLHGSVESSIPSEATCERKANPYKHVVLSLIFLKFVSDKFEERRVELVAEGQSDYLDIFEFYNTQIPVNLRFLAKNKKAGSERDYHNCEGESLFIDASPFHAAVDKTTSLTLNLAA